MQTAEIITRLRGFAWSMTMAADLAPVAFDAEDAVVINAASDRLATMEAAVRAAERLLDGRTFDVNDPHARAITAAVRLLEGELSE